MKNITNINNKCDVKQHQPPHQPNTTMVY